jgi:hypothetical protein
MIKRRGNDDTNISFLDVISCGFGAIVLLLVIVQTQSPEVIEAADTDQSASVRALQEELFALRGEIDFLDRELNAKHEQLGIEDELVAILLDQLEVSEKRLFALNEENTAAEGPRGELQLALQSLTEEMRRLYSNYQNETNYIGGIPVDSEYIIFVIDTSGSMFTYSWPRMIQELTDILDVYPSVKGIQIMNDMGQYMFTSFRGQWIPDTSDRREIIVSQLRNWHPFSNSSPVEGIQAAIQTFYQSDHKISIYVLGDDYTGRSLEAALDTVYNLNRQSGSSEPMVRIHAIGFPLMLAVGEADAAARFAALMREIAQQNLGSFVGLNDFR